MLQSPYALSPYQMPSTALPFYNPVTQAVWSTIGNLSAYGLQQAAQHLGPYAFGPAAQGYAVPALAGVPYTGPGSLYAPIAGGVAAPGAFAAPVPGVYAAPVPGVYAAPGAFAAPVTGLYGAPAAFAAPVSGVYGAPGAFAAPVSGVYGVPAAFAAPFPGVYGARAMAPFTSVSPLAVSGY